MDDLDMIMASLENGIGSIGGFVAGTSFVVEHQTLAGLGKIFTWISISEQKSRVILIIIRLSTLVIFQDTVFRLHSLLYWRLQPKMQLISWTKALRCLTPCMKIVSMFKMHLVTFMALSSLEIESLPSSIFKCRQSLVRTTATMIGRR